MKKLFILLLLVGCGNKPLVNVPKKVVVDIPKKITIEHKIDFNAINEFCESIGQTNLQVDECITDLVNVIRSSK
tara:strand:+ start:1738 stop:1959 length:222 start_codon:yes stop_codon:yes gene_type:complete